MLSGRILPLALAASLALLAPSAIFADEPCPEAKAWCDKLAHGNDLQRAEAAEMLGYVGDPATVSDLAEAFQPNSSVGPKAAEALGRIGGPKALRVLMTVVNVRYNLKDWPWEGLRQIGEAVGRIDGKAKTVYDVMRNRYEKGCLYSEAQSEDAMLFSMAWYGDEKAVGDLVSMMKTGAPDRQCLAASRLAELGNKKSDEEMCMILDYSKDDKLRRIVATSLGRRHAKLAIESLLDALGNGLELEASQALGMLGLNEAVKDLKPLLTHKDEAVRLNAAFALARLGDKSGVETARAMLDAKAKDSVAAAKAAATLAATGDKDGEAKLKAAWDKLNPKERYWFIKDCLEGDAWAKPFLKDVAAHDPSPGIKRAAADAAAAK